MLQVRYYIELGHANLYCVIAWQNIPGIRQQSLRELQIRLLLG